MKEIIIATQNPNKLKEFKEILEPAGFVVKCLKDYGITIDVEEPGKTFAENALHKAQEYSRMLNKRVLAEDSGIEVIELNGFPGIMSKRWKEDESYKYKVQELIDMCKSNEPSCRYVCSIAIWNIDKLEAVSEGYVYGRLVRPNELPGFGYDVGFIPEGYNKCFNEIGIEIKNNISHRKNALKKIKTSL